MRSLVLLLAMLGFMVGLLPLIMEFVNQNLFEPEVVYNGVYEPLRGVEMTESYEASLNRSFDIRSGLYVRGWSRAMPFVGAGLGVPLGIILHRFGFRLTRQPGIS